MKKNLILYALAIACCGTMFSSCSKVAAVLAKATGISWSGNATINVPVETDTTLQSSMGSGTFTYNLDSMIKSETDNKLGLSNIDTFEITSCVLTIQNPDSADNFANFEQAQLSFNTNYNGTTASMGEIDNNPNTYATTFTIPVNSSVNLKSYISPLGNTTFNYILGGKLRSATSKALTVNVQYGYYIHVAP